METQHAQDTKAATILGFVGVVLALIFSSDVARDNWSLLMSIGAGTLTVSTIPLAYALYPRKLRLNPDIAHLRVLVGNGPPDSTHWAIAASVERAIAHNEAVTHRTAKAMKGAATAVAIAVLVIGGTLVYSLQAG